MLDSIHFMYNGVSLAARQTSRSVYLLSNIGITFAPVEMGLPNYAERSDTTHMLCVLIWRAKR